VFVGKLQLLAVHTFLLTTLLNMLIIVTVCHNNYSIFSASLLSFVSQLAR